jgi:hypothetical protein
LNISDVDYSRSAFMLILFMHKTTYMNNFLSAHIFLVIKLNLSIIYILANDIRIKTIFFPNFTVTPRRQKLFMKVRVISKLPNSEQSSKRKVKTHKYINRQNQSTTGKL